MSYLRTVGASLILACGAQFAAIAQAAPHAVVTRLLRKDIVQMPGKEMVMLTVEYPPGSVDPVHRHNAYAFVYVLEGSIIMKVRGGKQVTLGPGQTFYEGPNDVHTVGRNASKTKPAKFVVVFLKNKGAPLLLPVQ
jgi:quercetin dioxygenase-like cupin family protein